ncbi:type II toxin-antitoxin system RelE/ParE family toxin [Microbispora sp. H10830]|uniref:type II toxin-antitoxin system RelE family toxin n=1 Tax=Microbispora sp. H10830 TaxID=2729109 RepID=UPI001600164A|nr:type II toxin-antitoxin system RelE/ParE family toxin [Microbispora sp. H10830]
MSDVVFTAPAVDDLRRIGPDAALRVLKEILVLSKNPEAGQAEQVGRVLALVRGSVPGHASRQAVLATLAAVQERMSGVTGVDGGAAKPAGRAT